ncbi:MAG: MaoC family dehydratase [Xanthomonadales bacterium]|nr:MaoC family dehydratase [Xanthomonadales bacterium]
MSASYRKTLSQDDVNVFAELSGDINPAHLDEDFARTTRLKTPVVHGALTASLISAVLGCRLPGPGCLYVRQEVNFRAPVRPGDTVTARATVSRLDPKRRFAEFDTRCETHDSTVIDGSALLWVPSREDSE